MVSCNRLTLTAMVGINTAKLHTELSSPVAPGSAPRATLSMALVMVEVTVINYHHHQYSDLDDLPLKSTYRLNPSFTAENPTFTSAVRLPIANTPSLL